MPNYILSAVLVRHELGVIEYIEIHTSDRDGGTGQGTDQDDVGRIARLAAQSQEQR